MTAEAAAASATAAKKFTALQESSQAEVGRLLAEAAVAKAASPPVLLGSNPSNTDVTQVRTLRIAQPSLCRLGYGTCTKPGP